MTNNINLTFKNSFEPKNKQNVIKSVDTNEKTNQSEKKDNSKKVTTIVCSAVALAGLGFAFKGKIKNLFKHSEIKPKLSDAERYIENRIKAIEYFKGKDSVDVFKERPKLFYSSVQDDLYKQIRNCRKNPYQLRPGCEKDISKITRTGGRKGVYVVAENGWHYRFARANKAKNGKVIDRISLNVYPEKELIDKLDKFITTSGINVEYKTPMHASSWLTRHDPITMYFREPITKDMENEIIKIASPHIRKSDKEVLLGTKLAESIYKLKEPTKQDVEALVQRAKNMDFDNTGLVEFLEETNDMYGARLYQINSKGETIVRTSPGLVKAVEQLLDSLEKLK